MTQEQRWRGARTAGEDEPRAGRRGRRAAGVTERRVVRTSLAEQVAAAALGVPGVVGLHAGRDGLAVTRLPDRWLTGVRLHLSGCEVHVVTAWEASVGTTTRAVRRAVAPLVGGAVEVTVDDIAPPVRAQPVRSDPLARSASSTDRGGSSARASTAGGSTQPSTAVSIRNVTV